MMDWKTKGSVRCDHEFIQALANHMLFCHKNGVIDRIDETYDEFLENQEVQAKVKELGKINSCQTYI